ncbi:MAG: hypothetical protein FIB07_17050 [Candidatus Methanoperedens sp.]|nr:hypothetical protein [Candidatus Methanoperedens sp.]
MITKIKKYKASVVWISDKKIRVHINNGWLKHPELSCVSLDLNKDPTEDQVRELEELFDAILPWIYWHKIYNSQPVEGLDVAGAYAWVESDVAEGLAEEFLRIGENN